MEEKKLTGYPRIDNPQNIGKSFFKSNPILPNTNVYTSLKILSSFYKNKTAIECHNLKANYKKLLDDAVIISLALKELGIKQGDIVTVSMPNFYQAVAIFFACNRIGAITTFLNSFATKSEINSYLNLFESPIFINFDKTFEENVGIKRSTKVKNIITLRKNKINESNLYEAVDIIKDDITIDYNSLGTLSKYQRRKFEKHHGIKEDSLILFTSGTTGKPKSVVLTNENIIAAGTYLKNSSNIKQVKEEKTLVCVPFAYPYGFATSTLMSLLSGKTAILAPYISSEMLSYYLKFEPNLIFGSPALLDLVMKNVADSQDLSYIKTFISGGDFLTPSAHSRGINFFEKHGAKVELGNGSGNAETVSCGTNPVGIKVKPETAGKVLTGTTAMIVDPETLEEKKYGEEGLLCVSGKHVFKEYYNEPELTESVKFEHNGKTYFKTGTLGSIDKEGYFTITGRESRFYIMSTLNKVYCDQVQNIISLFDCVRDCAVVQVPDEKLLFVNKAYIVLNSGYYFDGIADYIKDLCMKPITMEDSKVRQLKDYEIPAYLEFVQELPRKHGTDKIDYKLLEQDAEKKVADLQEQKVFTYKINNI